MKRSRRLGLCARTTLVAFLAVAAASALLAQPALATTPSNGSGTFSFAPISSTSRQADGNTFLEVTASETISGSITGAATVQFSQVVHADGSVNTNGRITCVCTVDGRTGTVVFRFEGTGSSTNLDGQFGVLSGTGGLADLRGQGTFHAVGLAGTYTFSWHFDP